ncbi:MAG: DNA-directed RNA polymerase subunit omega [Saprospiraceae bacterium]|nr:DNA-directed RNA polymerase subunit omega [Saprospiraceae bacterium]MBK8636089.1 DNA-directed RNA polymerase subunit omega [Saprospiraceae bacterium]MBP7643561.1 DNA-directed RNA polymerase subunit omega [Saprospiraceae bacterium]HMS67773.1 DNA-directed RNA polymerase subunit omega [Saprospiraceae bacterium]
MTDIKSKVQSLEPNIRARDVKKFLTESKNIYETLAVITKRANQISVDIKHELHTKLDEFSVSTDTIEEIHENKEQIEISKFYERLPNPVIIAIEEFMNEEFTFRYKNTPENSGE